MVLIAKTAGLHWFFGEALQVIIGIAIYNSLLVPITYPLVHRSFTKGILYQKPKFEQQ
jgi:rod shape-determining protein MreD